jgi:hypothetical protein
MSYTDYKRDLLSDDFDANYVLDRYYHSGQSFVFVGATSADEESNLKCSIARELFGAFAVRVHPFQLILCGSAHLGFSPVPDKLGTSFDPERSDIDVAVVSPELFDMAWSELQSAGLAAEVRSQISNDLFFGFINPAAIRDLCDFGGKWWTTFGGMKTDRAKGIRGRLYRNFWSMQSYHKLGIYSGRTKLLAPATAK